MVRKERIPVRGLKPSPLSPCPNCHHHFCQKRTNPREGIETRPNSRRDTPAVANVRKERIPVRGLKRWLECQARAARRMRRNVRKERIPVRGLKHFVRAGVSGSGEQQGQKRTNPREGIETAPTQTRFEVTAGTGRVRKERIPVRGLKRKRLCCPSSCPPAEGQKRTNPREGIETNWIDRKLAQTIT